MPRPAKRAPQARFAAAPSAVLAASATERATVLFTLVGVLTVGSLALITLAPAPLRPSSPRPLTAAHEAEALGAPEPDEPNAVPSRATFPQ